MNKDMAVGLFIATVLIVACFIAYTHHLNRNLLVGGETYQHVGFIQQMDGENELFIPVYKKRS